MVSLKKIPKFKNEREEGRWYAAHKDEPLEDAENFSQEKLDALLVQLPPQEEAMRTAKKYRNKTRQTSIRLSIADIEMAKTIASNKGLSYQTWLKSILHQAIEQEKAFLIDPMTDQKYS